MQVHEQAQSIHLFRTIKEHKHIRGTKVHSSIAALLLQAYRDCLVDRIVRGGQSCMHHLGVSAWEAVAQVDVLHPARLFHQPQALHCSICLQRGLQHKNQS